MKILFSQQIYEADAATLRKKGISSAELMEHAAGRCSEWLLRLGLPRFRRVHIFCGVGNNGGDGLVIARKLLERGISAEVSIIPFKNKRSGDFELNLERLLQKGLVPKEISRAEDLPELHAQDLLVDAIFGVGLKRSPEGLTREVIQHINASGATMVSIDLPSGLFSESPVTDAGAVVQADYTLTFQNPKLALFLPENKSYTGQWEILDIGLDREYLEAVETRYYAIDQDRARTLYRPRALYSHKGTFGHSLLIGGSQGKIGAVLLSCSGAVRAGSGLVTGYLPKCGYAAIQTALPEVMAEVDDENYLQYFNFSTKPDAIGIGTGLGMHVRTKKGFVQFLRETDKPLVLDADALNIISEYEELADLIPRDAILTPHPKEFERLVGSWKNDYEKLDKQLDFAKRHSCVVVLKGAHTSIAANGRICFNTSGNPALATAGSGDVLTGILTALLAQGYPAAEAAQLGVFLHGRTADLAVLEKESEESFSARDIPEYLGRAFKELR